jgi:hypothetical protein
LSQIFGMLGLRRCSLVLGFILLHSVAAAFNFTTCPHPSELMAPRVQSFNLSKVPGVYYELAFHDYTQFPTCPLPSCTTSTKSLDPSNSSVILDEFGLRCLNASYAIPLRFNATREVGVLDGYVPNPPIWWRVLEPGNQYIDTIVDFEDDGQGQYEWLIEFQCSSYTPNGRVKFVGVNFYSRRWNVQPEYVDAMIARGRARGLGVYLDATFGLKRLNHSECGWQ